MQETVQECPHPVKQLKLVSNNSGPMQNVKPISSLYTILQFVQVAAQTLLLLLLPLFLLLLVLIVEAEVRVMDNKETVPH